MEFGGWDGGGDAEQRSRLGLMLQQRALGVWDGDPLRVEK